MFASCNGHVEVVDKLLQHGARVDLQTEVLFISISHSNPLSLQEFSFQVEWSDNVRRKVRIRTILGFSCANLGC